MRSLASKSNALATLLLASMSLSLGFASCGVRAEGRCPPGQYPIGGAGVGGCAPIPGSGGGPPVSRPAGKWHSKWGALASGTNGVGGSSSRKGSKRQAKREAIAFCQRNGGDGCEVAYTYKNSCVAAVDRGPGFSNLFVSRRSVDIAVRDAREWCSSLPRSECKVVHTDCSLPEFERYF